MRIIFVRHGEPNYEKDCLTETGRKQAAAVAERLAGEGISEIYASPMGRAAETAEFTSKKLGLPVKTLDYLHEITWGGGGIPVEGHPWTLAERMINEEDFDFYGSDWREHPYFKDNTCMECYAEVSEKFDGLLKAKGYVHEGTRFLCETDRQETFAVFSHGGSGGCVLSHILALPMPYVFTVLPYEFTSVIILEFPVEKGKYIHPRIELFNDTAHNAGISKGLVIQSKTD